MRQRHDVESGDVSGPLQRGQRPARRDGDETAVAVGDGIVQALVPGNDRRKLAHALQTGFDDFRPQRLAAVDLRLYELIAQQLLALKTGKQQAGNHDRHEPDDDDGNPRLDTHRRYSTTCAMRSRPMGG